MKAFAPYHGGPANLKTFLEALEKCACNISRTAWMFGDELLNGNSNLEVVGIEQRVLSASR